MVKIDRVRFSDNRIFVVLSDGTEKSRPLEAFPVLMDATEEQRRNFEIWADGQSIRWENVDEDIHLSSFDEYGEPNPDNEIAKMIDAIGIIDIAAFANMIGMRKVKLDLFRYGIWTPSIESVHKIKEGLRQVKSRIDSVCGAWC